MTSRDFCYWLQGFFELSTGSTGAVTPQQTECIKAHLAMVFKHEIDPSMGPPKHQAELNNLHLSAPYPADGVGFFMRC